MDCFCGEMFFCLLVYFVFFVISFVISFEYISSYGDCSASGVHDDGGYRLCIVFGVVCGERAKYSLSDICRHNSVMILCGTES